jgi:hypothetical protein
LVVLGLALIGRGGRAGRQHLSQQKVDPAADSGATLRQGLT